MPTKKLNLPSHVRQFLFLLRKRYSTSHFRRGPGQTESWSRGSTTLAQPQGGGGQPAEVSIGAPVFG